jgi:hypothetical protein
MLAIGAEYDQLVEGEAIIDAAKKGKNADLESSGQNGKVKIFRSKPEKILIS